MAEQDLHDDAGGDGHQNVVAAGLHPVVAPRRRAQAVAAPVVHHVVVVTVLAVEAITPVEVVVRAGTLAPAVLAVGPFVLLIVGPLAILIPPACVGPSLAGIAALRLFMAVTLMLALMPLGESGCSRKQG